MESRIGIGDIEQAESRVATSQVRRVRPISRIICGGMLRQGTPLEDHTDEYGLWVKREDLACPPPGPPFSKTRGVYARIAARPEKLIGVLDTRHSQAGHAVARACQVLNKSCVNYYPEFKHEPGHRPPQEWASELGATLVGLKAGRSAVLYHAAKKNVEHYGGYMMPNALKLSESVDETAKEAAAIRGLFDVVLIPISSGTIAAGVMKGLGPEPLYLVHMGYSRSHDEVKAYLAAASGLPRSLVYLGHSVVLIDEGYEYKDEAREGPTPPWPCNAHYDLKAFRWWLRVARQRYKGKRCLLWNIG